MKTVEQMDVQARVRGTVKGFRPESLTKSQAASDQLAAEEEANLAILQRPANPEDPHQHDDARVKLARVRAAKQQAEAALRNARASADKEIASRLQPMHADLWGNLEQSVGAVVQAIAEAEQFKNAAGGAGSGFYFGGLNQLTAIRHQLLNVTTTWKGR